MAKSSKRAGTDSVHTSLAYEFIRQRILDGVYPPNYRLKTIVLAKDAGVSRTPVREALRQLQSEGLVEMRPRLGASVRGVSLLEFKEMCEVRLALECFSAEQAARNYDSEDIIEIQASLEQMKRCVAELDRRADAPEVLQELGKHDIAFHLAILNAAENALLKSEVLRLHLFNRIVQMNMFKVSQGKKAFEGDNQERRRWVLTCHQRIFDAIKARQHEAARMAMYEHLSDIIDRSVMAMARMEKQMKANAKTGSELFYATNS